MFALFAWDDPLPFLVARKFGLSYGRILQYALGHFLHGALPLRRPAPPTPLHGGQRPSLGASSRP